MDGLKLSSEHIFICTGTLNSLKSTVLEEANSWPGKTVVYDWLEIYYLITDWKSTSNIIAKQNCIILSSISWKYLSRPNETNCKLKQIHKFHHSTSAYHRKEIYYIGFKKKFIQKIYKDTLKM